MAEPDGLEGGRTEATRGIPDERVFDEISRLNNELVNMQRTLAKKNAELEALGEVKNRFLAIMAHDMRAPLVEVLSGLSLLEIYLGDLGPGQTEKIFREMKIKTNKALSFFTDLIGWAKQSMGTEAPRAVPIDLSVLAANAVDSFAESAANSGIALESRVAGPIEAIADPDMVATVFRNLLSNALKFTAAGGRILVDARREENEIVASVSDTGAGMSPSEVASLFRLEAAPSGIVAHPAKGAGLGLLLCKEFLERQGGKIWVESEKGRSSTFYFSLPRSA